MDKSTKRKEYMENQFEKLNLKNVRVKAYTPVDFDEMLNHQRPISCKWKGCTSCEYEYACLSSHIRAMQEGLKSNDEYFIIMEDDILLPFEIDYDALIKDIPKDAEIVQMLISFGNTVRSLYNHYLTTSTKYIPWQYLLPCAGMYLISRKGAEKIVKLFYKEDIKKYDFSNSPYQIVADVLLFQTVKTYSTTVPYAYPNIDLGSEIHPEHLDAHARAIEDIKNIIGTHKYINYPFVKKYIL